MLFNSVDFMIFFPIVTILYFVIPNRLKHIWLLVSSYYFYMCWNAKYAILIFFSTFVTYGSGLLIEKIKNSELEKKTIFKKLVVMFCFVANIAILFYFKYFNFVIDILRTVLLEINVQVNIPVFDIILPVGISFYTFQALGYTIDVYRDEIYAEKNFVRYALFVSFFPQLVAGPIERSKNLLKQLSVPKKFNYELAREGIFLMLWGFFLKIVLADRVAIYVDTVYGDYHTYTGWYLIVATILFAVQIYCDFAGYSTIAMGASKILGIELMDNFNAPYLSTSVADFWRKWHISLTSWFKDYVYIPLGGSRKGKIRKYVNKLSVFLISGLWHGADISFVVWGGLNGLYQVVGEVLQPIRDKIIKLLGVNKNLMCYKLFQMLTTFVLVDFSWVFFRANSFEDAINIIKEMFSVNNIWILFDQSIYLCGLDRKNFWVMIVCIVLLIIVDYCKHKKIVIRDIIIRQDAWFRILFIVITVSLILLFGKWGPRFDSANFIYFQF